jgi:alkanesulfonate monooxygenase SsuD/methylene tetrahydromethanopterin reductase-like flavin-dependent oxidoreductase (luciferase family)
MEIGIGLPTMLPGASGALVLDWAHKADQGSFSSLTVIDRVVYPNFEPMITLAAAAGLTRRIRLITSVLLAPLRDTAVLAKEAASLDAFSGGRLTLGLGIGVRADDFAACEVDMHMRGKRFDAQLQTMRRVWDGQPLSETVGVIGPRPAQSGGPRILIGGRSPEAIRRVARWGAGYIAGSGPPQMAQQGYALAKEAWMAAGKPGKPYFAGGTYFAFGPDAAERGGAFLRDFYGFLGPLADTMAQRLPTTPAAVKDAIAAFEDIGLDELLLWPTIADLDQLDRLADFLSPAARDFDRVIYEV